MHVDISQSVFPVSLRKPPRQKRRQNIYIYLYIYITFQLFGRLNSAKGSKNGQEKQTMMEPDVDLTPMHIPCILGDFSRPQIYKKKNI